MYKSGEHENVKEITDKLIERSAAGSDSRCVAFVYAALSRLALNEREAAGDLARRFDDECHEHRERFQSERERIAMVLDPATRSQKEAGLRDSEDGDEIAKHGRFLVGQGDWQAALDWARGSLQKETLAEDAKCDLKLSLAYASGKLDGPQAGRRDLDDFDRSCPSAGASRWLKTRRRMVAERLGLD
jgi:hypothetical protein